MGIKGLLQLLQSIQTPCNLKSFAGLTLGIDAYGWLHRGIVAATVELAKGSPTTKHVNFAMDRVRMLLYFGVTPYLVFDGNNLPSKRGTEIERAERRKESREKGLELEKLGMHAQAFKEFSKSIDVTPEMAGQLIEELRKTGVKFVVAPYEADAQLAYLERIGEIQGVLSEDSDMLVWGVKRLLTKLDKHGDGVEIRRDRFAACREINLTGWSDKEFRHMGILSGCDYLPNIANIGAKTAHGLLRKYKDVERILRVLAFEGKVSMPDDYLENFKRAELTFLHQWVYCPKLKQMIMFTEPEPDQVASMLEFLGEKLDDETARGVAEGLLNPVTLEPIVVPKVLARRPFSATPSAKNTPKPGVTIEQFFKAARTPLAELDPNSFTLSPTQRATLARQPAYITSTPLNGQVPTRTSTPLTGQVPARTPLLARGVSSSTSSLRKDRERHDPTVLANSTTKRICLDRNSVQTTPRVKDSPPMKSKSRFFQAPVDRGPLFPKGKRFTVFSDAKMTPVPATKPGIDEAEPITSPIADPDAEVSAELPQPTTTSRSESEMSEPEVTPLPTPTFLQYSREPSPEKPSSQLMTSKVNPIRPSALSRMGKAALRRTQSMPFVIPQSNNSTIAPLLRSNTVSMAETKSQEVLVRGSEDRLVPDSEGEEDIESDDNYEGNVSTLKKSWSFAQYAFQPS